MKINVLFVKLGEWKVKSIALFGFVIFFIAAGIAHFTVESFFLTAMPEWVPFQLSIVYLSGVVEILLAIGLAIPKTRKLAGALIAIFLVLIFPVNIYMVMIPEAYNLPAYILWLRLPLQLLFIWWVLKVRKY